MQRPAISIRPTTPRCNPREDPIPTLPAHRRMPPPKPMPRAPSKCRPGTNPLDSGEKGDSPQSERRQRQSVAGRRFEIRPAEWLQGRQGFQGREPVRQLRRQFQPRQQAARRAVEFAGEDEAAVQARRRKAERFFAIGQLASLPSKAKSRKATRNRRARNRPTPARTRSRKASSSKAERSRLRRARAKDEATISPIRPTARAASANRTATRPRAKPPSWPPWERSARLSASAPPISRAK